MKFKYIKCAQQGQPLLVEVEGQQKLQLVSNVTWEIVETGTTIPDNYKTIERTIPNLYVEPTLNVLQIEAAIDTNGKNWLTTVFGAANVITE